MDDRAKLESDISNADPSRPSFVRPALILAFIVLLAILAAVGFSRQQNSKSIEDMHRTMREWKAELEALPFEREILWGEALPGDAFADYALALEAAGRIEKLMPRVKLVLKPRPGSKPNADASDLLDEAADVFAAVRLGARRRIGRRPFQFSSPNDETSNAIERLALAELLRLGVQDLVAHERYEEAAHALLDSLQWSADQAQGPCMIDAMLGMTRLELSLRDFASETPWSEWPDEVLLGIQDALARLDARLEERPHLFKAEFAQMSELMRGTSSSRGRGWDSLMPWITGSIESDLANHAHILTGAEDLIARSPDPLSALETVHREALASEEDLVLALTRGFISETRAHFTAQAHLRILREALAFRLGRQLELENPVRRGFDRERDERYLRIVTRGIPEIRIEVNLRDR